MRRSGQCHVGQASQSHQKRSLAWNEEPQPQPAIDWGFSVMTKADFIISSSKSTVDPLTSYKEASSTTTRAPCFSNTLREGEAPGG